MEKTAPNFRVPFNQGSFWALNKEGWGPGGTSAGAPFSVQLPREVGMEAPSSTASPKVCSPQSGLWALLGKATKGPPATIRRGVPKGGALGSHSPPGPTASQTGPCGPRSKSFLMLLQDKRGCPGGSSRAVVGLLWMPHRCPLPPMVQLAERLPCSSHRVSHGQCSHLGCCFDPQDRVTPCYYGKTVTARCTPDGSFSLAVSRDAAVPPLSLDSLHLLSRRGGACGPLSRNEAFVVFNFPLSACGTIFKAGGHRIYENELSAERETLRASSGSISQASALGVSRRACLLLLPPPPSGAAPAQGPPSSADESYSSFYGPLDFPVVKLLREPVPLEVRLLGRRDPALHLLLHKCWAAPSADPLRAPQWPLLQDRCPYQGDSYQAQLVPLQWDSGLPFPSHHQRFVVRTFSLVDTDARQMLSGLIYFHCSASACLPSTQEPCGTRCEASLQGRRELVLCCRGSLSGGWGLWGSHCGSRTHTHTPSSPLQAREMPGEELRWRQGRCY
uniref:Zona pellucida sperm-binding protein 4 n=1 Tax=Naja naja TaxID=35670 RepID=A0A8C6V798_NAJNA